MKYYVKYFLPLWKKLKYSAFRQQTKAKPRSNNIFQQVLMKKFWVATAWVKE